MDTKARCPALLHAPQRDDATGSNKPPGHRKKSFYVKSDGLTFIFKDLETVSVLCYLTREGPLLPAARVLIRAVESRTIPS